MHLGLTIENSMVAAAVVTDGGDFVWQNSYPIANNSLPSLLTSCNTLVDTASRDNPGLNQTVGISAQNSLIDKVSPHDGLACLASVDLERNLQASLGRLAVLASPGQALALDQSCFGIAGLNRLYLNVLRKWPGYLLIERSKTQLLKVSHATFAIAKGPASPAAYQSAS